MAAWLPMSTFSSGRVRTTAEPGSPLAKARVAAHSAFDAYWRWTNDMTRGAAYRKLAARMNMRPDDCHIGMFNEAQCAEVIRICKGGL